MPEAKALGDDTPKPKGKRPTKALPTDRLMFSKQLDLLRAYAAKSGAEGLPVTNKQVGDILGVSHTTASLANAFFGEIGFLIRTDGGMVPAEGVREFQAAHEWAPETAAHALATILRDSWLWKALDPHLAMGSIDEREAVKRLASACSAPPKYERQLRTCLDFLEESGLIERDGGRVQRGPGARGTRAGHIVDLNDLHPSPSAPPTAAPLATAPSEDGVIEFSVSIRVRTEEIAGWSAERISAFFSGFAQVLAAKGAMERSENQ